MEFGSSQEAWVSLLCNPASPRNESIANYCFSLAKEKAITREKQLELQFYTAYITKLAALQTGDQKAFAEANENLIGILNSDDEVHIPPIVYHSIGKEMYKVALNTLGAKSKKQKASLMKTAADLFQRAVDRQFKHSYFYLGEIYERGELGTGSDLKRAAELYKKGEQAEDPRCSFQLSLL